MSLDSVRPRDGVKYKYCHVPGLILIFVKFQHILTGPKPYILVCAMSGTPILID